jgi:hypothetical protein
MNVQERSEVRELTATEMNEVTGGRSILGEAVWLAWAIAVSSTGQACCYGDHRTTETSK